MYLDTILIEQIVMAFVNLPLCMQEDYPESGHYLAKSSLRIILPRNAISSLGSFVQNIKLHLHHRRI